jgi:hypothetical protein
VTTLYPNSGALFQNDRKVHEKSPDFQGDVSIEVSLLQDLIKNADNGLVKIRLGGWRKESSRGWFVSLKVGAPFVSPNRPAPQTYSPPQQDEDVPF